MSHPTAEDIDNFKKMLGVEITKVRKNLHGWTRKRFYDHVQKTFGDEELSMQTLATYELGTRTISVSRLIQVSAVLRVRPDDLFRQAYQRTFPDHELHGPDVVTVNLYLLTQAQDPRLQPLKAWAEARFAHTGNNHYAVVELNRTGVEALANQTGLGQAQVLALLRKIGAIHQPSAAA